MTASTSTAAPGPIVETRGLGKRFAGVQALDDVSLTIPRGVVHALVGENGAGKSTLGKIIAGVHRPDAGELLIEGAPVRYASPRDALADGISAIQQEIALVPARSVLENVFLGRESVRWGAVQRGVMRRRFAELVERVPFDLHPDARVGTLRLADQQKVEVLRAIARAARVIVMDEPTAALTANETESLLGVIRSLREQGTTVVYVSHFLDEVLALADAITVLRNGRIVASGPASGFAHESLVEAMLGRALKQATRRRSEPSDRVVLRARDIRREGVLDGVSLEVRAGEIVGLAGLVGSGRSELARALCGVDRRDGGEVELDGEPLVTRSPAAAIRRGLVMLPESRKDQGLHMALRVRENVTLARLGEVARSGVVRRQTETREVADLLRRLDVRPPSPDIRVSSLSGGNQQKVLFGKWLFRQPKVLIADEPTRGVDVGAKSAIYDLIVDLADNGMGVLVISSEVEEVLALSHRILVMRRGAIAAELSADEATEERIMHAAFGTRLPAMGGA